jgi:hypothetical protein
MTLPIDNMFSAFEIFACICFIILIAMNLIGLFQNNKVLRSQKDQKELNTMLGEIIKDLNERSNHRDEQDKSILAILKTSEDSRSKFANLMHKIEFKSS